MASQTRLFVAGALVVGERVDLATQIPHLKARRVATGAKVTLFNGDGDEYEADIVAFGRREALAEVRERRDADRESPLEVTLVQGISKGDRMDFAVQKAVELGVCAVVPVFTRRCVVRLDADRAEKRRRHWQRVAESACEQSGRNRVPAVAAPTALNDWLKTGLPGYCGVVLDPTGDRRLAQLPVTDRAVALVIGPEGGLDDEEVALAEALGCHRMALGPRVLRTETAALAALAALQARFGDLG